MGALAAIVFDFDGVIADCRRGVLLPGAADFVRTAAKRVPIAIASGAISHEIEELLRTHDLVDVFGAIVGVDRTARGKPSPDPFLEALRLLRRTGSGRERGGAPALDPAHVVAVDDSVWGLVAARGAGMRCVGVAEDGRRSALAPHAELIVAGLHELTLDTLDTLVLTTRS